MRIVKSYNLLWKSPNQCIWRVVPHCHGKTPGPCLQSRLQQILLTLSAWCGAMCLYILLNTTELPRAEQFLCVQLPHSSLPRVHNCPCECRAPQHNTAASHASCRVWYSVLFHCALWLTAGRDILCSDATLTHQTAVISILSNKTNTNIQSCNDTLDDLPRIVSPDDEPQ